MNYPLMKTACFTGHRIVKKNFDVEELDAAILSLIKRGYNVFLNGMALGFDMLSFERVIKFKNTYPDIKLIACVPCSDQSAKYPKNKVVEYEYLLSKADEIIVLSKSYTPTCMKERNVFMVNNSSVCVAYLYKTSGGAYSTAKYAVEKEKEIIYVK